MLNYIIHHSFLLLFLLFGCYSYVWGSKIFKSIQNARAKFLSFPVSFRFHSVSVSCGCVLLHGILHFPVCICVFLFSVICFSFGFIFCFFLGFPGSFPPDLPTR